MLFNSSGTAKLKKIWKQSPVSEPAASISISLGIQSNKNIDMNYIFYAVYFRATD